MCDHHSCIRPLPNGFVVFEGQICVQPLLHLLYMFSCKTSSYTRQHCLLYTRSCRFKPGPHNCIKWTWTTSNFVESAANFAELQKGCKIVLARRNAPYLRVVTNDKYCTSYHSSYRRSPKPDQRLYSTTARSCLSLL